MSKIFKFAGVSRSDKGQLKVRFSDRDVYVKALAKANHTDIELVDLGAPMSKEEAIAFLINTDFAKGKPEVLAALNEVSDRRSAKAAREAARAAGVVLKRGRKPKAKAPVAEPAPAVESEATATDADLEAAPF